MSEAASEQVRERVDVVYRAESRRVLATLICPLGDFDLAEEALHDAFASALEGFAPKRQIDSRKWPKIVT